MAYTTRVFDLFYKRFPTGSTSGYNGYLTEDWLTSSSLTGPLRVSHSFLNFPDDVSGSTYITTTNSASLNNLAYRAIPWGSHACDFLWNTLVPSWSISEADNQPDEPPYWDTNVTRFYIPSYNSESFHKKYQTNGSSFGVSTYNVTSSWRVLDPKIKSSGFFHLHSLTGSSVYPTYISSTPISTQESQQTLDNNSYKIIYPVLNAQSTSSIDGQYFDQAGGAAISRLDIRASLYTASISASSNTTTGLDHMTRALKARRLFFPTTVSGSGTTGGTDYWFKKYTGYGVNEIFTENGGIYNVQLTLKKAKIGSSDWTPSSGSFMTVFIHNVNAQVPHTTQRVPGADGWYPPDNNIITIGNAYDGGPALSFFDIQTGYIVEKFNFNVIQYGYPAQFCIEVSGSYADNQSFGIIVDDIQICKIGVTTDPRFIKPTTISQATRNTRGGVYDLPPELIGPEEETIMD